MRNRLYVNRAERRKTERMLKQKGITMKIKTSILVEAFPMMVSILDIAGDMSLPPAASMPLQITYKQAKPIFDAYQAERMKLINELADKDGDDKPKIVEGAYQLGDNAAAYKERLQPLLDTEVLLSVLPIKIESFGATRVPEQLTLPLVGWLIVQ